MIPVILQRFWIPRIFKKKLDIYTGCRVPNFRGKVPKNICPKNFFFSLFFLKTRYESRLDWCIDLKELGMYYSITVVQTLNLFYLTVSKWRSLTYTQLSLTQTQIHGPWRADLAPYCKIYFDIIQVKDNFFFFFEFSVKLQD